MSLFDDDLEELCERASPEQDEQDALSLVLNHELGGANLAQALAVVKNKAAAHLAAGNRTKAANVLRNAAEAHQMFSDLLHGEAHQIDTSGHQSDRDRVHSVLAKANARPRREADLVEEMGIRASWQQV